MVQPVSGAGRRLLADLASFSAAGERPLRAYQLDCARAIVRSVLERRGRTFTVMFARQMGKNETSAQLEAYLLALHAGTGGTMVKTAPSFQPQIVNSMLRLKETLDACPMTARRWSSSFGYMVRLGRASLHFLSADRRANVVGATASLLLEVDEAQNVDPDKYDRDFRPMASATNATTVLYGTAWGEDSILERQKRLNLAHEARTGERLHFEYDWRVLAALNPSYAAYVAAEVDRLGESHPSVQTQYFLQCLAAAGRLFSAEQRRALRGSHQRYGEPRADAVYVAGVDLAGEDEEAEDAHLRALVPRRDSTVVTIAAVERTDGGEPTVRVVDHVWWTGRNQVWQYEQLAGLCTTWDFRRVAVDASGIGAGIASFLATRFIDRTEAVVFSSAVKSRLGYGMLAGANTGRLSLYADDGSREWRECWHQIELCRYQLRANEILSWSVPPALGHDDFVVSLALCYRAAEGLVPAPAGGLVRPRPDGETGQW